MAELLKPKDEFIKMIEEHTNYKYIDFGNGLVFVFTEKEVNVRQYHNDGTCLINWVKKNDFYTAINSNNKRDLKINFLDEGAEHTPGPWHIGKISSAIVSETPIEGELKGSGINDRGAVKQYGGYLVAESVFNKKNAQLIAAAPDLLAAAEKGLEYIQNGIEYGYIDPDKESETPKILEKAIKKAKGENNNE
ncbi:MAG: hypothetical protein BHK79_02760 [Halanaerobium sp. MDAL1]|nr:MAG: hypothetical protein BHK79_02760 [Halanaerobium sp. MDAL1]